MKWQIPGSSILVTASSPSPCPLSDLGSVFAFNAVLSLGVVAWMVNQGISNGCVILKRLRGEPLLPARWTMDKAGVCVNATATVYIAWAFFWSFWPNGYEPTAQTFNWAAVLFVGVMGTACLEYFVHDRTYHKGPVMKVEGIS